MPSINSNITIPSTDVTNDGESEKTSIISDYEVHGPILITSDDDFEIQGWPGEGTGSNPYVISGLMITSTDVCISIINTRVYFEITDCVLATNTSTSNPGIHFQNVENGAIRSCIVDARSSGSGFRLSSSSDNTLTNNTASGNFFGLHLDSSSSDNTLTNNTASGNINGFYLSGSSNNIMTNNNARDNSWYGFYLDTSGGCTLQDNVLQNNGVGIKGNYLSSWVHSMLGNMVNGKPLGYFVDIVGESIDVTTYSQVILVNSTGVSVENGVFNHASCGVQMAFSNNCILANNIAMGNSFHGFYFYQSSTNTLTGNIVSDNSRYGFYFTDSCNNNTLYSNIIGFNAWENAYDYGINNIWDDNVSVGNYWDDYDGIGNYSIPGTQNSVDRYPRQIVLPTLDSPPDITYDENENTTGLSITWSSEASHPVSYVVDKNGALMEEGSWNTTQITVDAGGLTAGTYNYTIMVADVCGKTASDVVFVTVFEHDTVFYTSCTDMDGFVNTPEFPWGIRKTGTMLVPPGEDYMTWSNIASGIGWGGPVYVHTLNTTFRLYQLSEFSVVGELIKSSSTMGQGYVALFDENKEIVAQVMWGDSWVALEQGYFYVNFYPQGGASQSQSSGYIYTSFTKTGKIWWDPWQGGQGAIFSSIDGAGSSSPLAEVGNASRVVKYVATLGYRGDWISLVDMRINSIYVGVDLKRSNPNAPTLDSPDDITYAEGTIGHSITWTPTDVNPVSYEVYRNGTLVEESPWDGFQIIVDLDGLVVGTYNYTLVVHNLLGLSTSDTILVRVESLTPPTINSPNDITYTEGSIGHSITWTPEASHPVSYEVYRNGTLVEEGSWDGSQIVFGLDGLVVGAYNFMLIVTDIGENTASDAVTVTVVDGTLPSIDSPIDFQYNEFATSYSITWTPLDAHPVSYVIYLDGSPIKSGAWNISSETITISVDGLGLGEYNYSIVVTDVGGNTCSDEVKVTVVDGTLPSIDSPVDFQYNEFTTGHSITWNPTDLHPVSYVIYLEGTPVKSGAWNISSETITISVDGLGLGEYNYTLVVTDVGGNIAIDTVLVYVTDGTAPTIDTPPDIQYDEFDTGHSIIWDPSDLHSVSYIIYLEGNPIKSGFWNTSSETVTVAVDGHGLGTYNYTLVVTDVGGNTCSDEVVVTVVDGTLPSIDSPVDFQYNEFTTGHSITWNPSDLHPVSYIIYLEGSLVKSGVWNASSESITIVIDGLGLGEYNYSIVVTDVGDNICSDEVIVTVVDGTVPIIDSPVDFQYNEFTTGHSITWNPSDAHPSSYIIYLEGSIVKSGAWNSSSEIIRILVDGHGLGTYNYTIVVIDEDDNIQSDEVEVTVVDATSPTIDSPMDVEYNEFTTGHSITWHPSDINPQSYIIYLDGTPIKSGAWNTSSEYIMISVDGLGIGIYNYTLVVTDVEGNSVSDEVMVIVVDATSPIVDSPVDVEYNEFTTGHSITWHPSDINPQSYIIYLDGTPIKSGAWNSSSETITISVDGHGLGSYNYTIVAVDKGGNAAKDEVLVTVVDGTPPTIDSPIDIEYNEFTSGHSITWHPTDLHPSSYVIYLDGSPVKSGAWNSSSESVTVSIDGHGLGSYNYTIVVTDVGGNTRSDEVTVTVVDGALPFIDSPADFQYNEFATGYSITWDPSDLHPVSYVIYLEGSPVKSGAWNSSSEIITVSVDGHGLGFHNYTIVVTDVGGNTAIDTVFVHVTDGTVPIIDSPADFQYNEFATGYSITWDPSDLHPVSYIIYLEGSPIKSGAWNISSETITISIDGHGLGEYNYTLEVTDIGGNTAADEVRVTVVDATSPITDSPDNVEYSELDIGNMIVWHPEDANPQTYIIYLNDTPVKSGLWNSSSESIAISVTGLELGVYNYTIIVTDMEGNTASDEVLVIVTDGTAPIIDSPADFQYNEFSTGHSVSWHPSDLHPVSYVIYLDGTPVKSGAWNSSSEVITVSVDGHGLGTYNYTIVVTDVGGNTARDEVLVTVVDGTVPTVDSPADFQYEEGQTGNVIVWNPDDLHPASCEILKDGNLLRSEEWTSTTEAITVSVDGLAPGVYNYTIVVTDVGGNTAVDVVIVTVTASTTTTSATTTETTTSTTDQIPPPDSIMIIVVVGAGAAGVIVIIFLLMKKRK